MIYYMLPGFYEHYELYKVFFGIKKDYPHIFNEDVEIYCMYGDFQFCIWDGGRIFTNYKTASKEKIKEVIDFYNNKLNIPIRYVFTNNALTQEDCYDTYCNIMLREGSQYKNEIVISSPILEEYIRKNYPSYKLVSSTTKCLTNPKVATDEIDKDYILTCLDYNLNKNLTFLNALSEEQKKKTEILANPICGLACPNRKEHYRLNSVYNLNFGKNYSLYDCKITGASLRPEHFNKACVSYEEIRDIYVPLGINHIKLEGRSYSDNALIPVLAKYLIKPEYQLYFIELMSD